MRGGIALALLALAAPAIVLAASPWRAFDLDRFFLPKELVLVVAAVAAGALVLARARRIELTRADLLLVAALILAAASALVAPNGWLAARALTIAGAGVALFWTARALARAGGGNVLVAALALAAVIAAATALLQAYGADSDWFSLNRAPGGTFGNRNFVAHIAAIGAPLVILRALEERRFIAAALWIAGGVIVTATLVLSRSRAAWLAVALSFAAMAWLAVRRRHRWADATRRSRLRTLAIATACGIAGAVFLPNTLEWRSDTPYLDSVTGVVNYREGSGHGRLVQYGATLRMAAAHPWLGVGPGNWPVVYPRFAARNDPSFGDDGMTANPWPSSDWMAFLSERGAGSTALLALALLGVLIHAWRLAGSVDDDADPDAAGTVLRGIALTGTLVATAVVSTFDAVLLLAAPAFFAWTSMGALTADMPVRRVIPLGRAARLTMLSVALVVGVVATGRGVAQLAAMKVFSAHARLDALERAAWLDPGSYRIQARLAAGWVARRDCARARPHAERAHALFPNAPAPKRWIAACRART